MCIRPFRPLTSFVVLALATVPARSADYVNPNDLVERTQFERRALVRNYLDSRREILKNAQLSSHAVSGLHFFRDGQVAERVQPGVQMNYELNRIGENYRITFRLYSDERPNAPDIVSTTGWNAADGRSRGLMTENAGNVMLKARIDSSMDDTIQTSNAAYFVADAPDINGKRFYDEIYADFESANVVVTAGNDEVVVEVPYREQGWAELGLQGQRRFFLDCKKGLAPTRMTISYKHVKYGKDSWEEEEAKFSDLRQVDGVFVPFTIEVTTRADVFGPEKCTYCKTGISEIKIGSVLESDLEVVFPEGTAVVDAIAGVYYTIGSDGKPVDTKLLVNVHDLSSDKGVPSNRNSFKIVAWLNIVAILGVLGIGFWRYFSRRPKVPRS